MNEQKYIPIKVVHLILVVAAVVLYILATFNTTAETAEAGATALKLICNLTKVLALVAGFIYMTLGYKKSAAKYYKAFMILLVVSEVLYLTRDMVFGYPTVFTAFLKIASLVLMTVLAVGKDFGKTKTYVTFIVLLVFQIILVALFIPQMDFAGTSRLLTLTYYVSNVILTVTMGFMILGKYLDKEDRGSK